MRLARREQPAPAVTPGPAPVVTAAPEPVVVEAPAPRDPVAVARAMLVGKEAALLEYSMDVMENLTAWPLGEAFEVGGAGSPTVSTSVAAKINDLLGEQPFRAVATMVRNNGQYGTIVSHYVSLEYTRSSFEE